MPYSFIEQGSNYTQSGPWQTPAFTNADQTSDTIFVFGVYGAASGTNTPTDLAGNTYVSVGITTGGANIHAYVCQNPAAYTSNQVSITFTSGNAGGLTAVKIRGLNQSIAPQYVGNDQNPATTGTDGITSTTLTPASQPGCLLGFDYKRAYNAGTPVAGTGFGDYSAIANYNTTRTASNEDKRITSLSAVAATFTDSTGGGTDEYITVALYVPELSTVLMGQILT